MMDREHAELDARRARGGGGGGGGGGQEAALHSEDRGRDHHQRDLNDKAKSGKGPTAYVQQANALYVRLKACQQFADGLVPGAMGPGATGWG